MHRGTYYYGPHETVNVLQYAVDLEVIRARSTFNSSSSHTIDKDFLNKLTQRDDSCIFTGVSEGVQGTHIIPHSKGDEWLELIIANRPNDEQMDDMPSIDDIWNGMLCLGGIHSLLESRTAVVLKTPNAILDVGDIVPRCQRLIPLNTLTSYPSYLRYTFQRFVGPRSHGDRVTHPDNNDATFLTTSSLPKPSGLLLNYNYGAAAVKRWGRNNLIITKRSGIPRPKVKAATMGPERTSGAINRERLHKKRKLQEIGGQEEADASGAAGGPQDSEVGLNEDDAEHEWDEDDIMLFFWGNSKAARERHERKDQERKDYIEEWKSSVPVN